MTSAFFILECRCRITSPRVSCSPRSAAWCCARSRWQVLFHLRDARRAGGRIARTTGASGFGHRPEGGTENPQQRSQGPRREEVDNEVNNRFVTDDSCDN